MHRLLSREQGTRDFQEIRYGDFWCQRRTLRVGNVQDVSMGEENQRVGVQYMLGQGPTGRYLVVNYAPRLRAVFLFSCTNIIKCVLIKNLRFVVSGHSKFSSRNQ